jgi:hypothetical protein
MSDEPWENFRGGNEDWQNKVLGQFDHPRNLICSHDVQRAISGALSLGKGKTFIASEVSWKSFTHFARSVLQEEIEEISEDHYCSRWEHNIEFSLFRALSGGPCQIGQGQLTQERIDRLNLLVEISGGWVCYGKKWPEFILLEEWVPIFEQYEENRRKM